MNIVFLVSGNGGNLKFFHEVLEKRGVFEGNLYVVADRDCLAISFCKKRKIPYAVISYSRENPRELQSILHKTNPSFIITNWHKIIDKETVQLFSGKMINLHYSLLPAFSGTIGTQPIKDALEKRCQFLGATVHWVEDIVDSGEIIAQSVIVNEGEFRLILEKIFRSGCFLLLNTLLRLRGESTPYQFQDKDILFAPKLKFDPLIFNKSFWDKIKEA